jgi:hypothetical protein
MGDDWPDLPVLRRCAFAVAPPHAHAEVRRSRATSRRPRPARARRASSATCCWSPAAATRSCWRLPVTPLRGFGRAWDRITIYLPVILMGLLALGTYWLARTRRRSRRRAERAPTHEPDYFLRGFSVKSFDPTGRLKSEITAWRRATSRHRHDWRSTQPRIRSYTDRAR